MTNQRRATRRDPQFDDMKDALWNEIVFATSAYAILTRVVFPIYNEPRLRGAYRLLVPILERVFTRDVLMALCRLFDPAAKKKHVSLANLLMRMGPHHAADEVSSAAAERRQRFQETIPRLMKQIETSWRVLVIHRNGYLAHRDLSKVTRIDQTSLTYGDMRVAIEQAQKIFGGYRGAFDGVDPSMMFEPIELRSEPDEFLRNHFQLEAGK